MICVVCVRERSRYVCPKCSANYCSLGCYKRHGTSCTEAFYQDQVKGEIALRDKEDAAKDAQHVSGILERQGIPVETARGEGMAEEQVNPVDQLCDRLKTVLETSDLSEERLNSLSVKQLESTLSKQQLGQFKLMAKTGQLNHLIKLVPYSPWWRMNVEEYCDLRQQRVRPPMIEEIGTRGGTNLGDIDSRIQAPAVWFGRTHTRKEIRERYIKLNESTMMSLKAPSVLHESFPLCVTSVLISYIHTLNSFNGEWLDSSDAQVAKEAVQLLVKGSGALREKSFKPDTLSAVVSDFHASLPVNYLAPLVHNGGKDSSLVLEEYQEHNKPLYIEDLQLFWKHPRVLVVDALMDAAYLVENVVPQDKKLARLGHKLYFMSVWANKHSSTKQFDSFEYHFC